MESRECLDLGNAVVCKDTEEGAGYLWWLAVMTLNLKQQLQDFLCKHGDGTWEEL